MRKSTMLWIVLAVMCGTTLYYTSQKVHDGREKIAQLTEQAKREEETIRVLTAEWSYLTQPKRLEKLAKEHLDLGPLKGRQFAKVEELPMRGTAPEVAEAHPVAEAPPVVIEKRVSIASPIQKDKAAVHVTSTPPSKSGKKTVTSTAPAGRDFGDVMKSLGVKQR